MGDYKDTSGLQSGKLRKILWEKAVENLPRKLAMKIYKVTIN